MRRAQLKADPIEGDDYPLRCRLCDSSGAGSVEDTSSAGRISSRTKTAKHPRLRVRRSNQERRSHQAETSATIIAFIRRPRTGQAGLVSLALSSRVKSTPITSDGRPDKTMKKLKDDFEEMVKTIKLEEE